MRNSITGLLLLALAALPASAATLKLKDGSSVQCKVQKYDTATRTLYVKLDDGKDAQYGMDQLDARSAYLVNASLIPDLQHRIRHLQLSLQTLNWKLHALL